MNWKATSGLAYVGLIFCLGWLIRAGCFFGNGPVSIGIQIAAVALMMWARVAFGIRSFHLTANPTRGELVTRGPYHYIRHPIYAAILYFVWTGIAAHLSRNCVLLGAGVTMTLALRMYGEETLLRRAYPEYGAYAARTARVMPLVL